MLCAVVGVPHEIAGHVGRAYIVPLLGHQIDPEN